MAKTALQGTSLREFRTGLDGLASQPDVFMAACGPALAKVIRPVRRLTAAALVQTTSELLAAPTLDQHSNGINQVPAVIKLAVPETIQGENFGEAASALWQLRFPGRAQRVAVEIVVPKSPCAQILASLMEFTRVKAPDLLNLDSALTPYQLLERLKTLRADVPATHKPTFEYALAQTAKLVIAESWAAVRKQLHEMDRDRAGIAVLVIQEGLAKFEPRRSYGDSLRVLGQIEKASVGLVKQLIGRIANAAGLFSARLTRSADGDTTRSRHKER